MSASEVREFFDTFVFGFIFSDIEREIAFAKSQQTIQDGLQIQIPSGGGNFLCALGLLCYTEFMGGILTGSFENGTDRSRFDTFFNLMGSDYRAFNQQVNVYKVFRCGMAHEYFIKKNAVIFMLSGNVNVYATMDGNKPALGGGPSMLVGPVQCGVGMLDDGRYFFVVEKYYSDFADTCQKVYKTMMSGPNPTIPKR